jgi:hypothetical protein
MKGNIKKLAVILMIAAMAIFMAMATASAWWPFRNAISGEYAVTGKNSCLAAFPPGFDPKTLQAPENGYTDISAESWEGVYKFKSNGTGTMDIVNHDVGANPGAGGSMSIHWDFHYTVEDGGKITFTLDFGSYIGKWLTGPQAGQEAFLDTDDSWNGVISPDGNHMFVTWGAPLILHVLDSQRGNRVGVQLICNGSFVLFRK